MQGIKSNEDNEWDTPGDKEEKASSTLPSLPGRKRKVEVQNVDGSNSD